MLYFNKETMCVCVCSFTVVGEKECVSESVSVRTRAGQQLGRRPTDEVLSALTLLRDSRSNQEEF